MSEIHWKEVRRTLDSNSDNLRQVIVTLDSGDKYIATHPFELSLGALIVNVYHADGNVTTFPIESISSVTYLIED